MRVLNLRRGRPVLGSESDAYLQWPLWTCLALRMARCGGCSDSRRYGRGRT